jgi:hypothetical protein
MDARQMSAMVEATRQGRLVEATALIQQTLVTPAATQRARDGQCAEEAGGTAGRHPAPLPPPPTHRGAQLGQVPSGGFMASALSPAGVSRISTSRTGPRPGPRSSPRAGLTPFPTPPPPAPVPTGSMSLPAARASSLPLIVIHGDRDATVAYGNAGCLIDQVVAAESPDRRPATPPTAVTIRGQVPGGHAYTRTSYREAAGTTVAECWTVHQGGHGWSGGAPSGPTPIPPAPAPAPSWSASSASIPPTHRLADRRRPRHRSEPSGCRARRT